MGDRPRLVHLTTTCISLELLLGPQLSAFADAGYEVLAMSAPGPFVPQLEARGITHVPLEHSTRSMALGSDAKAFVEVFRKFRELRPDIVHTHNPKPGVYGRIAAKLARVECIVNTVHGLYATPDDAVAKRAVVYGLERLAATCSDAELVQNPEDVDTLRSLRVPARKLRVLGNGVDLERFRPDDGGGVRAEVRAELAIDPDAVVIGAVGRLVLEKGYAELIEAWERVHVAHPDAVLIVAGPDEPGKADSVPRDHIRRGEAAGIRFLGMRDDVERLYHAMDLYVLASHREGYPRSAMEACACGVPVVATDIRGCRQVVVDGENGRLVPVSSPGPLADALAELVADGATRRRMGDAALQRARAHFDQQTVIDITLETYARLGCPPSEVDRR